MYGSEVLFSGKDNFELNSRPHQLLFMEIEEDIPSQKKCTALKY